MWWNNEENQEEQVLENEEKDEFTQLEKDRKEALKWAEGLPDSEYIRSIF